MNKVVQESEPPSCHYAFIVGRDTKGRWVVRDRSGSTGGIFVDRASALNFARRESHYISGAVSCAADPPELDFFAMLGPEPRPDLPVQPMTIRRAA